MENTKDPRNIAHKETVAYRLYNGNADQCRLSLGTYTETSLGEGPFLCLDSDIYNNSQIFSGRGRTASLTPGMAVVSQNPLLSMFSAFSIDSKVGGRRDSRANQGPAGRGRVCNLRHGRAGESCNVYSS